MGLRNQLLASGVLCYVCVSIGLIYTWPSSTIILFGSENTTLNRPMTEAELSLFGSLSSIGALVATPLSGYLLDKIGRKWLTICTALMHVLTWTILIAFKNVEIVLISCVISGIGGSGFLVVGVFVSEFCQKSIRGAMTSAPVATGSLGMLISYWIGGSLGYYTVIYICLTVAVIGVILLSFMKESPTHLMSKGLEEEAAKSIAFYRNTKINSKEVLQELEAIRRALNPALDDTPTPDVKPPPEFEKLNPESATKEKLSTWQFIKKSRSSRRAFGICFILGLLSIFQGLAVIQVYATPLFKEAVPNIPSTLCTVMLAVVGFIAALLAAYLTDVAGRRVLMIYASLAGGVVCLLLGSQLQVLWGPSWLTPLLIYIYCAAYTLGPGTVPFVLMAELFLPEIKGMASMLIVETLWLANFIILFIFTPLVNLIGLPPVFYIFSSVCFVTVVCSFILLPETKGLSLDAIQLLFSNSNKKNSRV